jgi:hypothetical protein
MGDQVLHPRARASIPGHEHVSAFFSDAAEPPARPAPAAYLGLRGIHRVMRLVLASGVAAAGLCLILGLTALAATLGTSQEAADPDNMAAAVKPVSNDGTPGTSASPPAASRTSDGQRTPPRAGRTIASLHGAGRPMRTHFRVGRPGTWGMAWRFTCIAGHTGHLIVKEGPGVSRSHVEIDASGRAGTGTTWNSLDPGRHSLTVVSDCSWSLRLMLPKPAAAS